MAMLRVSSYRRQFEEQWSRNGRSGGGCGGQYRSSAVKARGAAAEECTCVQLDFVAAKMLNKESLVRFAKDRSIIAALNDRFVALINMARCFEEDNESLEAQICELEERMTGQQTTTTTIAVPEYSLDAVMERLRKERDQSLFDVEELRRELECLQEQYEETVQQRTLVQLEQEDVGLEVDVVTTDCLALREQVNIYEEQLAHMEAQHETTVQNMVAHVEGPAAAGRGVLEFCNPDIKSALIDIKENYSQLAETIQCECRETGAVVAGAVVAIGAGKELTVARPAGVTGVGQITDVSELKKLIAELEKELAELEKCGEELEDEIEMKREAYVEEIFELECRLEEMRRQQNELQVQMTEQCDDYEELLGQKMAREIEIAAYRGLVEEEDERLCYL
ncbi:alpha-internexin [Oncorhynchus masou masou]|uniref:alpha-internexin n=1 Tax=Oncorhynchus masou masou TaxID=90313 RepID=UPI00318335C7